LRWMVGAMLLAVGVDGLVRHRHVRLGEMRVSARELATWSFLMASAQGAGLMVLPFVLGAVGGALPAPTAMHHHHVASIGGAHPGVLLAAGPGGVHAIAVAAPLIQR